LNYIEGGLRACWRNAEDLLSASNNLIAQELHGPGLSLAVLALEELAKLYAIDGLLFARPSDHKSEAFSKALKDHSVKLTMLELFPLLLANLARIDPRYGTDDAYHETLAISFTQLKKDGNAVMGHLNDNDGFRPLNNWKQRGFYVSAHGNDLISPRDAVDPSFAEAVHQFAWRAITTLGFILKGGNLERYIETARTVREGLTENQHNELEQLAEQWFRDLFRSESDIVTCDLS
jgi:AbiV family abortive infection protein